MEAKHTGDRMVRYCPECGLIGPVSTTVAACCPDSVGMSVRQWQAEKLEQMFARLRAAISRATGEQDTGNADSAQACNHWPSQKRCEWCGQDTGREACAHPPCQMPNSCELEGICIAARCVPAATKGKDA